MKKHSTRKIFLLTALLILISLMAAACSPSTVEEPEEVAEPAAPELDGDLIRGGQLYDKWWATAGYDAPGGDQALWAAQSTNTRSGTDTWRCKECHGWDYKGADGAYGSGSHFTGFVGVFQLADGDANDILATLQGSSNSDHDFSSVMAEQDLIDLAVFISQGLIDTASLVNDDKSSVGEAATGEDTYEGLCVNCHGPGGAAINFHGIDDPEFVGTVASGNPWEFIHKVRFGQPGWPMPSAIANEWSSDEIANVLAFAQTFSNEPVVSGGGPLYDKWWTALGLDEPSTDQPLWALQDTNTRSGKDTWRCKECHGWDYLGVDGAYSSGSHTTGFPGVFGASGQSVDELTAMLIGETNPAHDFSVIGDVGINALVAFIQGELQDSPSYINEDKSSTGDAARGRGRFENTCAACHGLDGTKINFGGEDDPEYIGTVAVDNPWEFFHKVLFGHPGEPMPSAIANGWSMEDVANVLAFAQSLATE